MIYKKKNNQGKGGFKKKALLKKQNKIQGFFERKFPFFDI